MSGVSPDVEPSEVVASGYDAVAERYAALEETEWPRARWLRDLLDRLPAGSAVLDLGCGNGVPAAAEVLARCHAYLGVDVSRRQIELARAATPAATFVAADMTELDLPDAFDAVTCFYALGHVRRARHPELLARIGTWLRPGGLLLLSEEDADRPDLVADWLGAPMFFSAYDGQTNRRLVEDAGLRLLSADEITEDEDGVPVTFLWVVARKPEVVAALDGGT